MIYCSYLIDIVFKGGIFIKNFFKITVIFILLCLASSLTAYAHGGRTDSSGGHKDNKNVSALGYYHYHHGYSAHSHVDGICQYETAAATISTPKAVEKATDTTITSDIKAYINSLFIPSFNYKNNAYVIAEDLSKYGFDVEWHNTERSLKIKQNPSKKISATETKNAAESYEIKSTDISTYVYNANTNEYSKIPSYNIGGETIIHIGDMGVASYNNDTRTLDVSI